MAICDEAVAGDAVTLTLTDEVDISRGDVLARSAGAAGSLRPVRRPSAVDGGGGIAAGPAISAQARHRAPCRPRSASSSTRSTSTRWSIWRPRRWHLNEVGYCNFALAQPLAFDPYRENRDTGGFILIDRFTNATVGAGHDRFRAARATNVHWQALDVNKQARAGMKGQKPVVLWFTGLSGSGKSTIANLVEKSLAAQGKHTYLLDGDNVRHGLNSDLGFTDADRVENIRRVGEAAKLFVDAGLIVLVPSSRPSAPSGAWRASWWATDEFIEVFVDTPIEVCMQRDPKGLYEKARAGTIKNFTGIDSPYETPEHAEITVRTVEANAEDHAQAIVKFLRDKGYLG